MSTDAPDCIPKTISSTTKMGMLARVTAAMGASPSIPTMKVSSRPRELVIRFCRMMGMARVTTSL